MPTGVAGPVGGRGVFRFRTALSVLSRGRQEKNAPKSVRLLNTFGSRGSEKTFARCESYSGPRNLRRRGGGFFRTSRGSRRRSGRALSPLGMRAHPAREGLPGLGIRSGVSPELRRGLGAALARRRALSGPPGPLCTAAEPLPGLGIRSARRRSLCRVPGFARARRWCSLRVSGFARARRRRLFAGLGIRSRTTAVLFAGLGIRFARQRPFPGLGIFSARRRSSFRDSGYVLARRWSSFGGPAKRWRRFGGDSAVWRDGRTPPYGSSEAARRVSGRASGRRPENLRAFPSRPA